MSSIPPITILQKMPGCSQDVNHKAEFVWGEMWDSKNRFIDFLCNLGERNVRLRPALSEEKKWSSGCEECKFYTNPERGG